MTSCSSPHASVHALFPQRPSGCSDVRSDVHDGYPLSAADDVDSVNGQRQCRSTSRYEQRSCRITSLDIGHSNLDSDASAALIRALLMDGKSHCCLTSLNLQDKHLGDDGIASTCRALKGSDPDSPTLSSWSHDSQDQLRPLRALQRNHAEEALATAIELLPSQLPSEAHPDPGRAFEFKCFLEKIGVTVSEVFGLPPRTQQELHQCPRCAWMVQVFRKLFQRVSPPPAFPSTPWEAAADSNSLPSSPLTGISEGGDFGELDFPREALLSYRVSEDASQSPVDACVWKGFPLPDSFSSFGPPSPSPSALPSRKRSAPTASSKHRAASSAEISKLEANLMTLANAEYEQPLFDAKTGKPLEQLSNVKPSEKLLRHAQLKVDLLPPLPIILYTLEAFAVRLPCDAWVTAVRTVRMINVSSHRTPVDAPRFCLRDGGYLELDIKDKASTMVPNSSNVHVKCDKRNYHLHHMLVEYETQGEAKEASYFFWYATRDRADRKKKPRWLSPCCHSAPSQQGDLPSPSMRSRVRC